MSVIYKLVFILIFLFTEDYIIAQASDSNLSSKEERKSDSLYLDSLYNLSYDLSFYDLDSALLVTEEFLIYSRKIKQIPMLFEWHNTISTNGINIIRIENCKAIRLHFSHK